MHIASFCYGIHVKSLFKNFRLNLVFINFLPKSKNWVRMTMVNVRVIKNAVQLVKQLYIKLFEIF